MYIASNFKKYNQNSAILFSANARHIEKFKQFFPEYAELININNTELSENIALDYIENKKSTFFQDNPGQPFFQVTVSKYPAPEGVQEPEDYLNNVQVEALQQGLIIQVLGTHVVNKRKFTLTMFRPVVSNPRDIN